MSGVTFLVFNFDVWDDDDQRRGWDTLVLKSQVETAAEARAELQLWAAECDTDMFGHSRRRRQPGDRYQIVRWPTMELEESGTVDLGGDPIVVSVKPDPK